MGPPDRRSIARLAVRLQQVGVRGRRRRPGQRLHRRRLSRPSDGRRRPARSQLAAAHGRREILVVGKAACESSTSRSARTAPVAGPGPRQVRRAGHLEGDTAPSASRAARGVVVAAPRQATIDLNDLAQDRLGGGLALRPRPRADRDGDLIPLVDEAATRCRGRWTTRMRPYRGRTRATSSTSSTEVDEPPPPPQRAVQQRAQPRARALPRCSSARSWTDAIRPPASSSGTPHGPRGAKGHVVGLPTCSR